MYLEMNTARQNSGVPSNSILQLETDPRKLLHFKGKLTLVTLLCLNKGLKYYGAAL
jgi:hypothetical protein